MPVVPASRPDKGARWFNIHTEEVRGVWCVTVGRLVSCSLHEKGPAIMMRSPHPIGRRDKSASNLQLLFRALLRRLHVSTPARSTGTRSARAFFAH